MIAIGQIFMLEVARNMAPPSGAGQGNKAGNSHSLSSEGVVYSTAWRSDRHCPQRAVTAMAAPVAANAAAPSLRNACHAAECHTVPISATRRACWSSVVDANSGIHTGLC